MKVLRKRILLDKPEIEESVLQLSPEMQEEFEMKQIAKWKKLRVFAVGDEIADIKEGDLVYVSPSHLQTAEVVQVDGVDKIMIAEMHIAIIW